MANIKVVLKPKQGIKIDSSNKYLYDPTLIQKYVDASREYSEEAKLSEANAKASEMNAELSEEQAKISENNAKLSENNAKTSETNAKNSEVKAGEEADASAESAYQSQQSALASYEYASNADEDAKNALETLGHVLESETKITQSEQNAKQSELNAKASETKAEEYMKECQDIKQSLGTVYTYRGSVPSISDLPNNAKVGDVYDVQDSGINYAWNGDRWDSLGASFDLSEYATKEYVDTTEQDIITNYMSADSDLQTQINGQASAISENKNDIASIESKIPSTASSSNMLVTNIELTNSSQNIRSDFAEADSELQTQINGQAIAIAGKQEKLTSGINIKTINGENILGSGNLEITSGGGGGSSMTVDTAMSDTSVNPVQNNVIKSYIDTADRDLQLQINGQATAITNKVDKTSPADKSMVSGWSMPGRRRAALSLGNSWTGYTAPANGWFYINKEAGVTGEYCYLRNTTNNELTVGGAAYQNTRLTALLPVLKNDFILIEYTLSGPTYGFDFIYAEGENN